MSLSIPLALFAAALLSSCGDMLSKPTSSEYSATCWLAQHSRRLVEAEHECFMALVNNDWGNNPKIRSQKLFGLGQVKQQLSKFAEAELLLKESLQIEELLASPPKIISSRRIELSDSLAGQAKWSEGAQLLEKVLPIAPQLSRQERIRIIKLLRLYSQNLKFMNQTALAVHFEKAALLLQ
jgi:hypothetical protein